MAFFLVVAARFLVDFLAAFFLVDRLAVFFFVEAARFLVDFLAAFFLVERLAVFFFVDRLAVFFLATFFLTVFFFAISVAPHGRVPAWFCPRALLGTREESTMKHSRSRSDAVFVVSLCATQRKRRHG